MAIGRPPIIGPWVLEKHCATLSSLNGPIQDIRHCVWDARFCTSCNYFCLTNDFLSSDSIRYCWYFIRAYCRGPGLAKWLRRLRCWGLLHLSLFSLLLCLGSQSLRESGHICGSCRIWLPWKWWFRALAFGCGIPAISCCLGEPLEDLASASSSVMNFRWYEMQ